MLENKLVRIPLKILTGTILATTLSYGFFLTSPGKQMTLNIMSNTPRLPNEDTPPFTYPPFQVSHLFNRGNYIGYFPKEHNKFSRPNIPAIYLGLELNTFPKSEYIPTSLSGAEGIQFYSIKEHTEVFLSPSQISRWPPQIIQRLLELKNGEIIDSQEYKYLWSKHQKETLEAVNIHPILPLVDLNEYTFSIGKDNKGIYMSVYDIWDFITSKGGYYDEHGNSIDWLAGNLLSQLGKPIHFYDRYYFVDYGITEDHLKSLVKGKN